MRPFAPEPDLSERIHDAVLNAICSGELKSGARITQEELAQKFGVSRQPVLQAMMLLRREGFLIDAGRKGRRVDKKRKSEKQSGEEKTKGTVSAWHTRYYNSFKMTLFFRDTPF